MRLEAADPFQHSLLAPGFHQAPFRGSCDGWMGDFGLVGFSSPAAGQRDGRRGFPPMRSNSADARELLSCRTNGEIMAWLPVSKGQVLKGYKIYTIYISFFSSAPASHGSICTRNSLLRVDVM